MRATALYWLCTLSVAAWSLFSADFVPSLAIAFFALLGLIVARVLDDSDRKLNEAVTEDALKQQSSLDELTAMASWDDLTGLANRRAFKEALQECLSKPIAENEFTALFFIDLDRFKAINDTLGHVVGDRFLTAIASRLQKQTSEEHVLARFGGDEFTLLVKAARNSDEVRALAESLMAVFEEPVEINGVAVQANASIGIAVASMPRPTATDLLASADAALYHAKDQGKGQFVIFEPTVPIPSRAPSLEGDLHQALANRELVLHFQPVVDLSESRIVGLEALLRWQHPRYGLLQPDAFLSLAEETGIIRALGDWVIESACERARYFQSLYADQLTISINLSPLQFRQRDLLPQLLDLADRPGVASELVRLEIGEEILRQDDGAAETLAELRRMGFKIAIDNFGLGYSSFGYLKRFDVDAIKLDRSLLTDLSDPRAEALLKGTIQLAQGLGIQVVAAGVETEEQLIQLRKAACDQAQGFFLGAPMTEVELSDMFATRGMHVTTTSSDRKLSFPSPSRTTGDASPRTEPDHFRRSA